MRSHICRDRAIAPGHRSSTARLNRIPQAGRQPNGRSPLQAGSSSRGSNWRGLDARSRVGIDNATGRSCHRNIRGTIGSSCLPSRTTADHKQHERERYEQRGLHGDVSSIRDGSTQHDKERAHLRMLRRAATAYKLRKLPRQTSRGLLGPSGRSWLQRPRLSRSVPRSLHAVSSFRACDPGPGQPHRVPCRRSGAGAANEPMSSPAGGDVGFGPPSG